MNSEFKKNDGAKNPKQEFVLADEIVSRREFKPMFRWSSDDRLRSIISVSNVSRQLSDEIFERSEIDKKDQPEKIAEFMEAVKEQLMVRDNYKPEFFLRELELVEDEVCFGFTGSYRKYKYQKFIPNLSFDMASGQFNDYFSNKATISAVNLSEFGRKEE